MDTSFAVHPLFKIHMILVMNLGSGDIQPIYCKQNINTRSCTASELVGANDASTMILWILLFMESQGCDIGKNILYYNNKSPIILEKNCKNSSSNQTHALNIRCFFLID